MSDTPSPAPEPVKPKLTLTPKVAAPAPAPVAEEPAAPATQAPVHSTPTLQTSNSNATPASLLAASNGPRASLKLQGAVHPATEKVNEPSFTSPIPAASSDAPSGALVALAAIAAAASITFAALLFLKNQ